MPLPHEFQQPECQNHSSGLVPGLQGLFELLAVVQAGMDVVDATTGIDWESKHWFATNFATSLEDADIKKPLENQGFSMFGGAEEDRTPDLRIANATLSQLSYRPK